MVSPATGVDHEVPLNETATPEVPTAIQKVELTQDSASRATGEASVGEPQLVVRE